MKKMEEEIDLYFFRCYDEDKYDQRRVKMMSYTQVYSFQNLPGFESFISIGNSDMTYMGFARILLKAGESL